MSTAVDIQGLREQISGQVLQPWSDGYDEARRVHNGAIDKRPAAIVEARATADVVAAVRFANEAGLEISVRGGGHNVAGRAVTDGGSMIDLSAMKGIQIDPVRKIAHAEPGLIPDFLNTNWTRIRPASTDLRDCSIARARLDTCPKAAQA